MLNSQSPAGTGPQPAIRYLIQAPGNREIFFTCDESVVHSVPNVQQSALDTSQGHTVVYSCCNGGFITGPAFLFFFFFLSVVFLYYAILSAFVIEKRGEARTHNGILGSSNLS